ncbi:hypothetical protein MHYP_G00240740 [Metynnis hypsauchen]
MALSQRGFCAHSLDSDSLSSSTSPDAFTPQFIISDRSHGAELMSGFHAATASVSPECSYGSAVRAVPGPGGHPPRPVTRSHAHTLMDLKARRWAQRQQR